MFQSKVSSKTITKNLQNCKQFYTSLPYFKIQNKQIKEDKCNCIKPFIYIHNFFLNARMSETVTKAD